MKKAGKGLAWALGVAVLVVAALAAAPFLVPLDSFIPELARIAGEKLGQPVAIAELRLHLLPTPRAVAKGIVVGKRQEVTVGELQIVPELFSLFSGPKTVRLVRAEQVHLKEAALAFPGKMPKGGGQSGDFRIHRVELRGVTLQHSKVRLPEFDLDAVLGEAFALEEATLATRDGNLKLLVDPQDDGPSKVLLHASQWTVPAGTPIRFERLDAQGTLKGERLDLPSIGGILYGGKLAGSAHAEWGRLWQVSGKAVLEGVDVVPLQQAMGQKAQLSGRLKTELGFSAKARTAEQLQNALALDGPFEVVGGAYHGYDLSKVGIRQLEAGGSTSFDELKGVVQVRGREIKVTELCARSPSLVAGGNVTVSAEKKLSGKLDVSVAKTGGFVGIPVALGGTTAEPSFSPTKGYVIGAAIGTVLLPGIGTSLGASAGSRLEGTSSCK